jgi:hypothetical protein
MLYQDMFSKANDNIQNSNAPDSVKEASKKALQLVTVKMSGKMTTCAGKAGFRRDIRGNLSNPIIKLSNFIFSTLNDEQKFDTISHEFAHIVDGICHNHMNGHSYVWQRIHHWMGGSCQRCHNYEVKRKTVKRVIVERKPIGGTTMFTIQRFKRFARQSWFNEDFKIVGIAFCNGRTISHKHIEDMSVQRCMTLI